MIDKCHNPYFLCSIEYVILVCGEGSADGWFFEIHVGCKKLL